MSISETTLTNIKAAIRIEEVVGDFVPLKRKGSGQNLWACCPFPGHNEKTPSFSVHPSKGFYKCFGCGEGGDAITFLQKIQNMDYVESMRYLANKYQIEWSVEQQSQASDKYVQEKESLYLLMEEVETYYQDLLAKTPKAQAYLAAREISNTLCKHFKIGYSSDAWQACYEFALEKGYDVDILEKAGLVLQKNNQVYDRFRDRILFPIHDTLGRVVGFGGRLLKDAKDAAKYINSPETLIYKKNKVLYGLYQAKEAIQKAGFCYLVEGYTDVLALVKAGINPVVASAGTALTVEQVSLLKRFSRKVVLLLDGDAAGLKAAYRGGGLFLQQGFEVKMVPLQANEDPASCSQRLGKEAFLNHLQNYQKDFVLYKLERLLAEAGDEPQARTAVIREIVATIAQIPDKIQRTLYLDLCSKLAKLERSLLEEVLEQILATKENIGSIQRKLYQRKPAYSGREKEEATILHMLLHYGDESLENGVALSNYVFEELEEVQFTTPSYKKMYHNLWTTWQKNGKIDARQWLQDQPEDDKSNIVTIMAQPYTTSKDWLEKYQVAIPETADCLEQLIHKNILRLKLKAIREWINEHRKTFIGLEDGKAIEEKLAVYGVMKEVEREIAKQLGIVVFPAMHPLHKNNLAAYRISKQGDTTKS